MSRRLLALVVLLCWHGLALAQDAPQPPCDGLPLPPFAAMGAAPNVVVWRGAELRANWVPPWCLGWTPGKKPTVLVALSASFAYTGTSDNLLARFGHVTALHGVQYWSVFDGRWRPLVTEVAAVSDPGARQRRPDFSAAEMRTGRDLYFVQSDSRSSGKVTYRMRLVEGGSNRLVIAVENVTPIRLLLLPLFAPGGLRSTYIVQRLSPGSWGFYSVTGAMEGLGVLGGGHQASYVNRAAALYRHITGVPTNREPPLAPR